MTVDPSKQARRVLVIGLGGTIAMTNSTTGGVAPALSTTELLAAVPGLAATGITVDVLDFRRIPGASLGFDDLDELLTVIASTAEDIDGIVITQGTDTIEETAFHLDLHHHDDRPVVVTGAMRNPTMAGADGPANLLAAVQTAASPAARGLGVLVVLADEIHAAHRVRKTHTSSTATFASPNGGPLGYLVEGQPHILSRPTRRSVLPIQVPEGPNPNVALVIVVLGDTGDLLDSVDERFDGLVLAAMGAGHVPEKITGKLTEIAARIPVVLASRTGAGAGLTSTYGFTGSERDLIARGLIPAGFLDPLKARLLLRACLSAKADHTSITTTFRALGYNEPDAWPWSGQSIIDGEMT